MRAIKAKKSTHTDIETVPGSSPTRSAPAVATLQGNCRIPFEVNKRPAVETMTAKGCAHIKATMWVAAIFLCSLPMMSVAAGAEAGAILKATTLHTFRFHGRYHSKCFKCYKVAGRVARELTACALISVAAGTPSFARTLQGATSTQGVQQLSGRSMELYNEIMRARASRGLSSIPMCSHLNTVAALKVADMQASRPSGRCNMHSWSQSPRWSGCCYTSDHAHASCMWNKPRELTSYRGNGFEIAHGAWGANVTPRGAVQSWMGSPSHRDVMLNAGMWGQRWGAIGVGISDNNAVAWFGKESC
jgi:hypothetical protein